MNAEPAPRRWWIAEWGAPSGVGVSWTEEALTTRLPCVTGPVCSFCGGQPVVALFEGPGFTTAVRSAAEVRAEEVWAACSACEELVKVDGREALVRRGARRWRPQGARLAVQPHVQAEAMARHAQMRFWEARSR